MPRDFLLHGLNGDPDDLILFSGIKDIPVCDGEGRHHAVSDHAENKLAQRGSVKWQTAWLLLKDIALTGTGLVIIVLQMWLPEAVGCPAGRRARAYRAVRRYARRVDPQRAWSTAVLGVIGAAWGAGLTTVILIFGVIR